MGALNQEARFRRWTNANRDLLLASGVPMAAWESWHNWNYLLGHGCLTYAIDPSNFDINHLNVDQLKALRRLIELDEDYGRHASISVAVATLIDAKSA